MGKKEVGEGNLELAERAEGGLRAPWDEEVKGEDKRGWRGRRNEG